MNDRQLFRKLLLHFAIGATLGAIFFWRSVDPKYSARVGFGPE
jgi:hypothetical protein